MELIQTFGVDGWILYSHGYGRADLGGRAKLGGLFWAENR